MTFAEELLELAQDIASLNAAKPRQARIRRAVSTAYYALFHLLISEATLNWTRKVLRPQLGRLFDHGPMSTASINKAAELSAYFKEDPPEGPERTIAEHLRVVATTFDEAQQRRVDADYNLAKEITETEMLTQIEDVTQAFKSWDIIRDDLSAQQYLLSLPGAKERRQPRKPGSRKRQRNRRQQPPAAT
jgi:uncharacterized protein (UPF0332 family)